MQQVNMLDVVARTRFDRIHLIVLLWCGLILTLVGYVFVMVGAAMHFIIDGMDIHPAKAGFMASSALFGMMFGAIGMGVISDKIGRRLTLSLCVLLFSVFTAAAGLTNNLYIFSAMRLLAGIGIGGALPNAASHMTEYSPQKMRGFMTTLMCCGYALGSILAAVLGKQFIESHGWQTVFFVAGLPVLLIPLIMLYLPESISYLLKKQDHQALGEIAKRIDPSLQITHDTEFVGHTDSTGAAQTQSVKGLFADGRGFGTLMLWLAFITSLFMLYALSSWLVKLLAMVGHSLGSALNFLLAYNFGAIAGVIVGGFAADRLV